MPFFCHNSAQKWVVQSHRFDFLGLVHLHVYARAREPQGAEEELDDR